MKILTKEEEDNHYNETLKGGFLGGSIGLLAAGVGVYAGAARFPMIRHLTLPMKAFLVTSGGTFGAIITADHYSRAFEAARHPAQRYTNENERIRQEIEKQQTAFQRGKDWVRDQRYKLVGGSWVASIATAFAIVNRDKYMTTQQKIVQARVYAQGFTVLVMVALAAFELSERRRGEGRWETVKIIDPNDPEHKRIIEKPVHHESFEGEDLWRDMVDAEEERMKRMKKEAHQKVKKGEVSGNDQGTKQGQKSDSSKKKQNGSKKQDSSKQDDPEKQDESKKQDGDNKQEDSKKSQDTDKQKSGGDKKPK